MKVRKNLANDFQSLCKTLKIRIVAANGYTSGKRVGKKMPRRFESCSLRINKEDGDFLSLPLLIRQNEQVWDIIGTFGAKTSQKSRKSILQ